MKRFKLTPLEKACLLTKAGLVESIEDYYNSRIHLKEMDGPYDPIMSPAHEASWDEDMEVQTYVRTFRASLSAKSFVIVEKHYEFHTPERADCVTNFYVFQSEGEEVDSARVTCAKLEKIFRSSKTHLPEALEMLRVEFPSIPSA